MKKSIIIFLLVHVSLTETIQAQYVWTQKANFVNGARAGASSFTIGSKAYYTCGINSSLISKNDLWEYDASLNTWTQLASLTGSVRYSPSAFAINGLGYVCLGWQQVGGSVALNDLWQYNPTTNTWIQKADFIGSARYTAVAFVIGNKAYVGTGYTPLKNDIYEYDATNDTWTALVNQFPGTARQSSTAFSLTYTIGPNTFEKGYVCTGATDPNGLTCANDLWEFTPGATPGSGTWAALANFPGSGRYASFAFALNGKGFVGGGMNNINGLHYFTDMFAFDPVSNSWMAADSFPGTNRMNAQTAVIGNKAYAGTGTFLSGSYSDQMWEYGPSGVAPNINLQSSDTVFCEKQCIDFSDLSTNNPTSWQWFFAGAVPDTSSLQNPANICYNNYGSFDVQLIACNTFGCDTLLLTQFIHELKNPDDSIYGGNDTIWSLPYLSYQWYETTSGILNGETNQYYVPSQTGNYYCIVTDTNGCVATSNTFTITGNSGPLTPKGGITIFPNPNNGNFEIVFNTPFGGWGALRILNSLVQVVFSSPLATHHSLLTSHLETGIYFIEIKTDGKIYRQKMIVE